MYPASERAPIVIFIAVGRDEGVTTASMIPETPKKITSPIAIVISARPSRASALERVRGPGAIHAQNSGSPAPHATTTAMSSRSHWCNLKPSNTPPASWLTMNPPAAPALIALSKITAAGQIPVTPKATHWAAIQALLVHTCAANEGAGEFE